MEDTVDHGHAVLATFINQFTALSPEDRQALADHIKVHAYKKGDVILREGQVSKACYFVLLGCLRQYRLVEGVEKTIQFYTENQAATMFTSFVSGAVSEYYLACLEDTFVIFGDADDQNAMYTRIPKLQDITRSMMEEDFGRTQDEFARFIASSPEERYLNLVNTRPDLLRRVPQHQLAGYLGVTPESLSRIRGRLAKQK
jgi:CRP-like cAMP-binding protein